MVASILVGMPVGRLRRPGPGLAVFLNASAVGVLVFLLRDVLSAAWAPVDAALAATHTESANFAPVAGYGLLFLIGISAGLLALVAFERWMRKVVSRAAGERAPAQVPAARVGNDVGHRVRPAQRHRGVRDRRPAGGVMSTRPVSVRSLRGASYWPWPPSAAGSIVHVIVQLITVGARANRVNLRAYGLLAGLFAGFITDGILIAAGA